MLRRTFIASTAAFLMVPKFALALTGRSYKKGLVEAELAAGKTVFLDFYTDWCTTCRSQGRTIAKFKKANPAYEENIVFVAIDWDEHAQSSLARRLKIPRRATLVVLKGDEELGRMVSGTSKSKIKALLDIALAASVA